MDDQLLKTQSTVVEMFRINKMAYFRDNIEEEFHEKREFSPILKNRLLKKKSDNRNGFLRHEWSKFGQQKGNNVFSIISPVVDACFNSLKHFADRGNVLNC